jgi:hypothetical protein
MIFDVAKFAIWLIDRYDLHQEVLSHLSESGEVPTLGKNVKLHKEEPIMVEKHVPYVITFEESFKTGPEIKDKIIDCTNFPLEER